MSDIKGVKKDCADEILKTKQNKRARQKSFSKKSKI